jgi:hypothetical protein
VCDTGDLNGNRAPESFSKLLLERCRDCGDSEDHKNAFLHFATRILPAVNASQTRFDKRKCSESLSECFSCTDEAFGILLVVNYEARWRSQHTPAARNPSGTRRQQSELWEDGKHASATERSRRGVSWQGQGLMKFNELSEIVKKQRGVMEEMPGASVNEAEWDLMAWCRSETGMSQLASSRDNEDSGVNTKNIAGEDEVEPVGECDTFEI